MLRRILDNNYITIIGALVGDLAKNGITCDDFTEFNMRRLLSHASNFSANGCFECRHSKRVSQQVLYALYELVIFGWVKEDSAGFYSGQTPRGNTCRLLE